MSDFSTRYGPWALIAGGAQGIGAAFAQYAAEKGLNVVLLDRCKEALQQQSELIEQRYQRDCLSVEVDLGSPDMLAIVCAALADREIGLLVYNAALADVGPFYKCDSGLDYEQQKIAVNVSGPLTLTYHYARAMLQRQRGGIILMSSGAGLQGSPYYAHYAATKAYNIALAEALWYEFKPCNVDVLACVAGMTLSSAASAYQYLDTSLFQTPEELVEESMIALGQQATLIAGADNRKNRALLQTLPREQQIELIARHAIDNFLDGEIPEQFL